MNTEYFKDLQFYDDIFSKNNSCFRVSKLLHDLFFNIIGCLVSWVWR